MAMLKLPLKLLEKVASFAPVDGIASLGSTCRQMRALPPSLWATVHQTHFPHTDAMEFGGPLQSLQLQRAVQVLTSIDAAHVEIPLPVRSLSDLRFALRVQGDVEGQVVDVTTMGLQMVKYKARPNHFRGPYWKLESTTAQQLPHHTALCLPPDLIDFNYDIALDDVRLVASLVVLRKSDGATALVTTLRPNIFQNGENWRILFSQRDLEYVPPLLPTRWSETQGLHSVGLHDNHSLTILFNSDPCSPIEVNYHLNTRISAPTSSGMHVMDETSYWAQRTGYDDQSLGNIFHALLDIQKNLPLTTKVVIPRKFNAGT
jgi:hypothetical protein